MEAVGLAIAVFNEVFEICVFIRLKVIDAANHDQDFGEFEIKFNYQHTILQTFGNRFIHGKIIYKLEDDWVTQISQILQQLKKTVIAYQSLSTKYNERYSRTEGGTPWWGRKKVNRDDLKQDFISSGTPVTRPKGHRGFRNRFWRSHSKLEWALFDRQKLENILEDHKGWTDKLIEIMKLTLLLHSSTDIPQVEDLTTDAQALGFSKLTNKRLLILDPSRGTQPTVLDAKGIISHVDQQPTRVHRTLQAEAIIIIAEVDGLDCLIEYKRYIKGSTEMDLVVTQNRVGFLSKLLSAEEEGGNVSSGCRTSLHCLGYFHEPEKSRFGLAFQVPRGFDRVPMSLRSGIITLKADKRPTLGQRFGIAYTIGYAMMEWFLVDWVHKSISSNNIYLLRESGQDQWDFSSAYLGGFEYARPGNDKSNEASSQVDFHTNVYRHPARQGQPSEGFNRVHDIYAFGVLLLEIGLWVVASSQDLFRDENQKPNAISETLVKNARLRLGHFMGERYRDAVLFCLEGASKVEGDDEQQRKLTTAFKKNVLDICEEGKKLL